MGFLLENSSGIVKVFKNSMLFNVPLTGAPGTYDSPG
jgi:hypothetical protein